MSSSLFQRFVGSNVCLIMILMLSERLLVVSLGRHSVDWLWCECVLWLDIARGRVGVAKCCATRRRSVVAMQLMYIRPTWNKFGIQSGLIRTFWIQITMKKRSDETQTLGAGCSKAEPNIFAPPQTPFPGALDGQNLVSWRWSLPLSTNPVWWGSMHAISSYRGKRPTHKHPRTHKQTGPITIHCAAASAQCNQ